MAEGGRDIRVERHVRMMERKEAAEERMRDYRKRQELNELEDLLTDADGEQEAVNEEIDRLCGRR